MAVITTLIIAENPALTTDPYTLALNPIQPRGLVKNTPVSDYPTLSGVGGLQMPKNWFPRSALLWPAIMDSLYSALRVAFEDRMYVATGLDYYIGATVDPTDSWIFPTTWSSKKYIKIRVLEVRGHESPVDNDIAQLIYNLEVVFRWMDAS